MNKTNKDNTTEKVSIIREAFFRRLIEDAEEHGANPSADVVNKIIDSYIQDVINDRKEP